MAELEFTFRDHTAESIKHVARDEGISNVSVLCVGLSLVEAIHNALEQNPTANVVISPQVYQELIRFQRRYRN